jgi:hypothetical protein
MAKMIKEKKTGEMYSSKKAMMKHEKSEGPKMRAMEYGKKKAGKAAPGKSKKMC